MPFFSSHNPCLSTGVSMFSTSQMVVTQPAWFGTAQIIYSGKSSVHSMGPGVSGKRHLFWCVITLNAFWW